MRVLTLAFLLASSAHAKPKPAQAPKDVDVGFGNGYCPFGREKESLPALDKDVAEHELNGDALALRSICRYLAGDLTGAKADMLTLKPRRTEINNGYRIIAQTVRMADRVWVDTFGTLPRKKTGEFVIPEGAPSYEERKARADTAARFVAFVKKVRPDIDPYNIPRGPIDPDAPPEQPAVRIPDGVEEPALPARKPAKR